MRHFASNSVILMYHRVAVPDTDPWALCVTPAHFAEHLQVLKGAFTVMSVRDLARSLRLHHIVDRSIAISFDDGYADNFQNARPLLDDYDLPATIFMTSGNLKRSREFWWDELEQMLLNDRPLPEKLMLATPSGERNWQVDPGSRFENLNTMRAWEGKPGSRMALYHEIWEWMLRLPSEEQNGVLDQLMAATALQATLRPSHRSVTADEIQNLAHDGLIEIGGHTVNHPMLSAHSESIQRQEIENNKAQLEELTGTGITCFAYPFGDHDATTVRLAREAGFECACTTVDNTVWRYSDPFRMPRIAVEDWDGDQLAKRLNELLG